MHDDELWFYYTGLKWRSTFKYIGKFPNGTSELIPGRDRDGGAICLATLRRDGFISLDAGDQEGHIVTKVFTMRGGKLYVNADARDGELKVEVLNAQNEVVAVSQNVEEDSTRKELQWRLGQLAHFEGQVVALRFTFRNAQVYSYWLE